MRADNGQDMCVAWCVELQLEAIFTVVIRAPEVPQSEQGPSPFALASIKLYAHSEISPTLKIPLFFATTSLNTFQHICMVSSSFLP